ncbi:hypothetical protein PRIPAC_78581 [Pristionchus pacificus]|uniref:Uncharacterized protein n=1 Tax=Pristionchus pacificus TaxID=54126 RepID=A0A2A6CK75_PRIPA|nr:hypothetical protein PRIPAC_78581 [Pristionchus pacificus]|eukprot:PDM78431.1 hypothetical protein PRIPAC_31010 [Pristionchus pacificus]
MHMKLVNAVQKSTNAIFTKRIAFGVTLLLLFAYNAGYQGTMIDPRPSYDDMRSAFAHGEKLWYFRTAGTVRITINPKKKHCDFADSRIRVSRIWRYSGGGRGYFQRLVEKMCESPGGIITYERDSICLHASIYTRLFAEIHRPMKAQSSNEPLSIYEAVCVPEEIKRVWLSG